MPQIISCPECARPLRVPDTFAPGDLVKCPRCNAAFPVPGAAVLVAVGVANTTAAEPAPDSPAPSAAGESFFEEGDQPRDPLRRTEAGAGFASGYRVDLGAFFGEGMKHYSTVLGRLVGYGCLFVLVEWAGYVPYVGYLVSLGSWLFLDFAFFAGFALVCLLQLQGKSWSFGDLFGGFRYWLPLFLLNLLWIAVYLLCFLPVIIAMGLFIFQMFLMAAAPPTVVTTTATGTMVTTGPAAGPPITLFVVFGVAMLFSLLAMVPLAFVYVRCFLFAPLFIIDRGCGPIEAIKHCWEFTRGHFWGWLGVSLLLGLLYLAGRMPCALGLPFLLPIYYLVLTAAYLRCARPQALEGMVGPI